MATFIFLVNFTEQGVRAVKDTAKRADAFKQMAQKGGVSIKSLFWTLGRHDVIAIGEAPDDETATAIALSISAQGNVRTETMRAFSSDEMTAIINKMA